MNNRQSQTSKLKSWLTWQNLLIFAILVWATPRILPHIGAIAGIPESNSVRPELSVRDRNGRLLTIDSLAGKVVLLNVWATWCAPCRVEMPALQSLADKYGPEGLVVLGLSVDRGPEEDVDEFLRERQISYPVAIVDQKTLSQLGGVRAYPTSLILDRNGIIRHKVLGPIGPLTLRPAISRLLKGPSDQ